MDYNSPNSPLWDFSPSPSGFSQLAEGDFLALLQKQFNPDLPTPNAYAAPHDVVDPSKITNLPTPAPPPPLSDDSSPSPPSTSDHLSSSRRQSTNSTAEQDTHELKRKASIDTLEEDSPNQKTCMYSPPQSSSRPQPLSSLSAKKSPSRRKSGPSQVCSVPISRR